jgi:hypothetical protein
MIKWQYFFGGQHRSGFDRYYFAIIDGVRVEKHSTRSLTRYSIGNMDKAKETFETEEELLNHLKPQ